MFYLFDSEGGEDEDTERTVSSAPMGEGAPARTSAVEVPVQPSAHNNNWNTAEDIYLTRARESFVKYPANPSYVGRTRQSEKGQCYYNEWG